MKSFHLTATCLILCLACTTVRAQQDSTSTKNQDSTTLEVLLPQHPKVSQQDLMAIIDKMPVFGIYKDNYFISGIPLNEKITPGSADAKYQISFRHRITKTILPFNTALLLTYSQLSFWNVYEKSLPFRDSNFNPGLALAKPITHKDHLIGVASISMEHQSNGRDSTYSRSWNFLSASMTYFQNDQLSLDVKVWIGVLAEENKDLFDYKGFGQVKLNYRTKRDHLRLSATINPRSLLKYNTILEVSYRPVDSLNQYLFLQWYQGYAESLLDYDQYGSMLRAGICIKPDFKNF